MTVETQETTGRNRLALIVLSAAYFFIGTTSLGTIGLVTEMSAALRVSVPMIATLVTVFAVVYAISAPCLQAWLGGVPRRMLISIGLVLMGGSCLVSAAAPDFLVTVLARIVMAAGAALTGPTLSAAGAAIMPPHKRAQGLAAVFAGLTIAMVFGIPLISYLGTTVGWRWAWALMGFAAIAVVPAVFMVLPASNRGERATLSALFSVMRDRAIALAVSTTAIQIAGQFITYALLAVWLMEHLGMSRSLVPTALFVYALGGATGNALASTVEARLGAERTVKVCIAVMGCSLAVMWVLPAWPVPALAVAFLWSMSGLMMVAPMQSRLIRLSPDRSNLSLALNASAMYVGMSTGAALSGIGYALLGVGALPLMSALGAVLAFIVFRASLVR